MIETLNVFFDELVTGERFVTRGRTITETDVVMFSAFSGDYHPLHTDAVWAATGPFGRRVAHGMCTLAIATGLTFSLFERGESKMLAFYGMDRVRFLRPVAIGDTIHVEGEIIQLEARDSRSGVMTIREEIKTDLGDVAVTVEQKSLLKRRESEDDHGEGDLCQ